MESVTIQERTYDFLLTFYSNYGSISHQFWDIQCRKILRPSNPSQELIEVTLSLRRAVSEIFDFKYAVTLKPAYTANTKQEWKWNSSLNLLEQ